MTTKRWSREKKQEKDILIPVTIKIHPRLLANIDEIIDHIRFRSRAHVINCAVCDWFDVDDNIQKRATKALLGDRTKTHEKKN